MEPKKVLRLHSLTNGLGLWCHDGGIKSECRTFFESGYIWLHSPIPMGNPIAVETMTIIDEDGNRVNGTVREHFHNPQVLDDDFAPRRSLVSRYAKKMVDNNFYGTVNVSDLPIYGTQD